MNLVFTPAPPMGSLKIIIRHSQIIHLDANDRLALLYQIKGLESDTRKLFRSPGGDFLFENRARDGSILAQWVAFLIADDELGRNAIRTGIMGAFPEIELLWQD